MVSSALRVIWLLVPDPSSGASQSDGIVASRYRRVQARRGRHIQCRVSQALSCPIRQLSPFGSSNWNKRFEISSNAAEKGSPAGLEIVQLLN